MPSVAYENRATAARAIRSPAAVIGFVLTTLIGVGLDQWSKVVAFDRLAETPTGYAFIPGWLHFRTIWNPGAVFGIAAGQRGAFLIVSAGAIIFIGYLFASSEARQRIYHIILGMLLAGVLGNMYDRIVYHQVRDMIYIFPDRRIFGRELFPWIFNVADSLLCVGVAMMLLYSVVQSRSARMKSRPSDDGVIEQRQRTSLTPLPPEPDSK